MSVGTQKEDEKILQNTVNSELQKTPSKLLKKRLVPF